MKTETEKSTARKFGSSNPPTGSHTGSYTRVSKNTVRQTMFTRICNGLKGHIFDCADSRQANQFNMMLR